MAILNNNPLVGASGNQGGYNINNSVRFRSSASASLTRTPSSATNRKTWTWSGWVKRGLLSSTTLFDIYYANNSTALFDRMYFHNSNGTFELNGENGVSVVYNLVTTQVFRDPSAWYHIVVAFDTTQATASNRIKIYVNGNQVTAFSTSTYPSLNFDTQVNNNVTQYIGTGGGGASDQLFDGYMAEVNFIDGSAKTPSDFGETDTTTGVWKPKAYTGTYGTNGFYLKFSDIATTSGSNAGLGKDFSGNSNYWTTNNISVTSGTTYDAMTDVPTNTSATVANYAVLNPLNKDSGITVTQANLQATGSVGDVDRTIFSTMSIPSSQKIYFEVVAVTGSSAGNYFAVGIAPSTLSLSAEVGITGSFGIESNQATDAYKRISGTYTSYGAGTNFATNDIVQVAIDQANGKIWFGKNNTWFDSGNPSAGTNPATSTLSTSTEYFPVASFFRAGPTLAFNFGQRPFSYTPPTGYVALNTYNLPTPTILQGNKYMDATLWTGNGTVSGVSQTITNASAFKPDFVWVKSRSNAYQNALQDSVRGAGKTLFSALTNAEAGNSGDLITSFNSNGFTVNTTYLGGFNETTNNSGSTYVGWQWQAGQGSTSSNTSGSITSTVSVNTTAGFSVVTYTGTGANATVGHGLGVAPKMVIVKSRTTAENWMVYHTSTGATKYIYLDSTGAAVTLSTIWNNTAPTSSVFSIGTNVTVNQSSTNYVAYCFADVSGYSKAFSYTGNGSSDGPFVYLGFRPKCIIVKRTDTTANWIIYDTSRSTYNVMDNELYPNLSNAEDASSINDTFDFLSNGFKCRNTWSPMNASGGTYIYMAFAENPFKNSLAR